MGVSRQDVIDTLATCDAGELRLVLEAAAVPPRGAESPRELAERVVNALWWHWCTPAGYALDRVDLDSIVKGVARRLKVKDQVHGANGWDQLASLNAALVEQAGPVAFEALRPDHQARARGSIFPTLAWGATGGGTSYALGAGGRLFLKFAATPVGRILPWIPQVAPWFKAIKKASAVAAVVGTPLAVGLGVLAVHQSLGTRWRKVMPLLLSVGALQAHQRVRDVEVIGA